MHPVEGVQSFGQYVSSTVHASGVPLELVKLYNRYCCLHQKTSPRLDPHYHGIIMVLEYNMRFFCNAPLFTQFLIG